MSCTPVYSSARTARHNGHLSRQLVPGRGHLQHHYGSVMFSDECGLVTDETDERCAERISLEALMRLLYLTPQN